MSDSSPDYVMEIRVKPETLRMLFFIAFWTMSFILIAVSYQFNPEAIHDNAMRFFCAANDSPLALAGSDAPTVAMSPSLRSRVSDAVFAPLANRNAWRV